MKSVKILKLISALLLVLSLGGCFLAPAINSMREAGLTEADRRMKLAKDVREFSEALYWGDAGAALIYVVPEAQQTFREQIRKSKKAERIVESKVENVVFLDGSYEADVDLSVRYFEVPFYVVNERVERQAWKFSLSDGWKISTREFGTAPKS